MCPAIFEKPKPSITYQSPPKQPQPQPTNVDTTDRRPTKVASRIRPSHTAIHKPRSRRPPLHKHTMPSGKKKKSSAKKKANGTATKEGGGKKRSPISLEDVLSQAESAMEMANVEAALQLFEYAASVLRDRVHGDAASATHEEDKKTLTSVLGKLGELKASVGDVEGARTDFLDAIELMGHPHQIMSDAGKSADDETMELLEDTDVNLSTAQNCEHIASLYLYLGQLSSGSEALTAFRTGVQELKKSVAILDRRSAPSVTGTAASEATMDVDDSQEMSSDELSRYLEETR